MQFHRTVLPNGLRVITVPMPSFESATVMVMVGAGSRYETTKNSGISHFLEHMFFKGTKSRPNPSIIAHILDNIGAQWNAFTGKETTAYYIKSAASQVELSLDLLSDLLQHSLFDATEIAKERGVIIEEINMYEDVPMRKLGDVYEELLYGNTPMGWDIAGTKDVINSIQRDDFIDYMKQLYSANNITVVIAGGVDTQKVEELVKKYFSNLITFNTLRAAKVIEKQKKPSLLIKKKKTEQAHVAIGFRTVGLDHPDRYALDMLSTILGGGTSSRLFHEVREKRGLAYYVRTSNDTYTDVGSLATTAGVDAKRIDEAIEVIMEQYNLIKKTGEISREELQKAKEYDKGHFVLDLEDSRSVASFYAHEEILEKQLDTPHDVMKKTDAVTLDDINRVIEKYITPGTLNLAVIGNFTDRQKFEKLLK